MELRWACGLRALSYIWTMYNKNENNLYTNTTISRYKNTMISTQPGPWIDDLAYTEDNKFPWR